MKCKHCESKIDHVKVHIFDRTGGEHEVNTRIKKCGRGIYCIETSTNITALEYHDNYEEFTKYICCPKCDKFPFKGSISFEKTIYTIFGINEKEAME